jgi:hypothetical protein
MRKVRCFVWVFVVLLSPLACGSSDDAGTAGAPLDASTGVPEDGASSDAPRIADNSPSGDVHHDVTGDEPVGVDERGSDRTVVPDIVVDQAEPGDGNANSDAVAACSTYYDVYCSRLRECYPLFRAYYDSVDNCKTRNMPACPQQFAAPGTSKAPNSLRACATAMMAQSCTSWIADAPLECTPNGTLADGVGCEYDAQCLGGFCNRCQVAACDTVQAISHCGKCQAKVPLGGVCDPRQKSCDRGLRCARGFTASQWTCVARVADAGACVEYYDCPLGYYCSAGTCIRAKQLGESCTTAGSAECDFVGVDLYCAALPNDAGHACAQTTWVGTGQACNFEMATLCGSEGTCSSNTSPGVCGPAANDGQPCGVGHSCQPPSLCVKGACQPPPPASSCP